MVVSGIERRWGALPGLTNVLQPRQQGEEHREPDSNHNIYSGASAIIGRDAQSPEGLDQK
jgi:hypothetical protein